MKIIISTPRVKTITTFSEGVVLSRSHPFPLLDPLPHPSLKPLERHK
jgi:hypothetical protein